MTTYQKLKAENLKLKQQLDIVCNEPDTLEAITIVHQYKFSRHAERVLMSGGPVNRLEQFHGFLKIIS